MFAILIFAIGIFEGNYVDESTQFTIRIEDGVAMICTQLPFPWPQSFPISVKGRRAHMGDLSGVLAGDEIHWEKQVLGKAWRFTWTRGGDCVPLDDKARVGSSEIAQTPTDAFDSDAFDGEYIDVESGRLLRLERGSIWLRSELPWPWPQSYPVSSFDAQTLHLDGAVGVASNETIEWIMPTDKSRTWTWSLVSRELDYT